MVLPRRPLLGLAVLATFLSAASTNAQIAQQGSYISPVTGSLFGYSVRLSSSGNVAVVGQPGDQTNLGAAWIVTRTGGTWSVVQPKLVGVGGNGTVQYQGNSVAISGDGATVAVGATSENASAGCVYVFSQSGGTWSQYGLNLKLTGSGEIGAGQFGFSTALSGDGNTLVVGAPYENSSAGAVWVFVRSGGTWSQQGSKLVGTGAVGAALQGYSVAISSDGNTILVGGAVDNSGMGAMWVFTRSGSTWTQQGSKLVGTGATGTAQQGISVSLSADGTTAALGGNFDASETGAVWIFTRSGSVWTQQGTKLVGSGATPPSWQGLGTGLSGDGNTLIVGGMRDASYGAAWVFARRNSVWSQVGNRIALPATTFYQSVGRSVAVSSDGNTFMVGSEYANLAGSVYALVRPAPALVSIKDVPNDQGGQVSLRWTASVLDYTPSSAVDAYGIWRQVPSSAAARLLSRGARLVPMDSPSLAPGDISARSVNGAGSIFYWEYLGNQPAHGYPGYSYTAATTSDSIPGSNPKTVFMVEAQQNAAGLYWPSYPDSGYSVDNLFPTAPAGLNGTYTQGATQLYWKANTEIDLGSYRLYRGTTMNFAVSSGNLVAQLDPSITSYLDQPGAAYIYKLTAVDVHGNESAPATLLPGNVTGVDGVSANELALAVPASNPGDNATTIRYSLPHAEGVRLAIYDVQGRRVRTLVEGAEGAGTHETDWDRDDASGHRVGSGVYFVKLAAHEGALVRRLVLVR